MDHPYPSDDMHQLRNQEYSRFEQSEGYPDNILRFIMD